MNCDQAELWISRALDGELPHDQAAILDEHLERCAACRRLREQWIASARLMREHRVAPAQTPEAAWADVQRTLRLQGESRPRKFPLVFGWRLQVAGVMLALVVVGFGARLMRRAPTAMSAAESRSAEATVVEMVESGLPGASTLVYEDSDSGMMVIWVLPTEEKEKKHADS